MKNAPTLRACLYLFLSLFGMLLGSLFFAPLSSACHLFFVLLALLLEKGISRGEGLPAFAKAGVKGKLRLLLLFPLFALFTLSANLLSAKLTLALGGTLPTVTPSFSLFLGAVLLAPLAEELLFRGLLFRLFSRYGDRTAVLLSALLFAIAHGSVFQAPYALIAGLLLGVLAVWSEGVLFPLLFHFAYNLLAFFGDGIPKVPLLLLLAGLAVLGVIFFLRSERPPRFQRGERLSFFPLLPLLLYALFPIALAVLNF